MHVVVFADQVKEAFLLLEFASQQGLKLGHIGQYCDEAFLTFSLSLNTRVHIIRWSWRLLRLCIETRDSLTSCWLSKMALNRSRSSVGGNRVGQDSPIASSREYPIIAWAASLRLHDAQLQVKSNDAIGPGVEDGIHILALHHTELDLILEIFDASGLGVFVWHCAVPYGWVHQVCFAQDESRWSPVSLPGAAI